MVAPRASPVRVALLGLALACTGPACAAAAEARILLQARVLPVATLRVEAGPTELVLTAADIARGWVAVPQRTVLSVRSNALDSITVRMLLRDAQVTGGTVTGLPQQVRLQPEGALVRIAVVRGAVRYTLRWRLELAADARPGTHPWPVQMHVEVL